MLRDKELESYSTSRIIRDYELETMRSFINHLGLRPDKFYTIHITGTSGKGSTANYISNILIGHGLRVGLFTSPHITSIRERICIDGKQISESDFSRLFNVVKAETESFIKEISGKGGVVRRLTYFEVVMAIALFYFEEQKIDVGVIEVGLGGKLDTTNVLNGNVAVITNVGLDHTEILGDTVEKIARDKVQIVKKNAVCVSGVKQPSVKDIVKDWCEDIGAELLSRDKEFGIKIKEGSIEGSIFDFSGLIGSDKKRVDFKNLEISIPGVHQVENAACAIEASCICLKDLGLEVDRERLARALKATKVPGRFEIKQGGPKQAAKPLIIWDGAHNADKMRALVSTVDAVTKGDIILFFAVKKGKDIEKIINELATLKNRIRKVVLTKYKLKQDIQLESEPVEEYIGIFQKVLGKNEKNRSNEVNIEFNPDAKAAYKSVVEGLKKDEILLVTGSFYLLATIALV